MPPGPSLRDWALLAISLSFVVMGLFIARGDPLAALMPVTFFGACALTFGFIIARKRRRRRFTATSVAVAGGVKLRASNARMLALAAVIGVPGIAIFLLPEPPLVIRICGAVMVGASALLVVGVLTGRIARRFLRFDPPGLTIGEAKFEYCIPWDEIADIAELEMHDNAVVGFDVLRPETIRVTPESARERVYEVLGQNKSFTSRHVMIMPFHFAAQAESLAAALRTYAEDPEARAELVAKPRIS